MHIGKKKITISALIVVVFVSVIVWAARFNNSRLR